MKGYNRQLVSPLRAQGLFWGVGSKKASEMRRHLNWAMKLVEFPQMARVRKKGILSRGNNKCSDKKGRTDVIIIRDYNSSGMARLAFPRRCSGGKNVPWSINIGKGILYSY